MQNCCPKSVRASLCQIPLLMTSPLVSLNSFRLKKRKLHMPCSSGERYRNLLIEIRYKMEVDKVNTAREHTLSHTF